MHKARWHGTIVAVKILKDIGHMAIGDFRTELNVLQKVHHPHTVRCSAACLHSRSGYGQQQWQWQWPALY